MRMNEMVRDWMTTNPVVIQVSTPLSDAHRIMSENKVRRLPVMDGERLVGIITRGDIRGAEASEATSLSIWELNYLLSKLNIDQVMTRQLITVSPDSTIGEAAQLMLDNKIAGLPVLDGEKLVGIITESDIFRLLVKYSVQEPVAATS
jgi:CBS domain-containing protein